MKKFYFLKQIAEMMDIQLQQQLTVRKSSLMPSQTILLSPS